jgi:hypothetical protein
MTVTKKSSILRENLNHPMLPNVQKNVLYAGAAVLAVLLAVGGYMWYRASSVTVELSSGGDEPAAAAGDSAVPAPTPTPTEEVPTVNGAPSPAPAATTPTATLSYTQALKTYGATGYRFQFVSCRATPGKLVVKRGQKFMMDNRDQKSHKFNVQGRSFTISGLNFPKVKAGTPGTSNITSDGGGSADLQVQK